MRPYLLTLLIACACSHADPTVTAPAPVPPFPGMPKGYAPVRRDLPVLVAEAQVRTAIDRILAYQDSPRLQTDEDRAVMSLLRDYASGRRALHVVFADSLDINGYTSQASYLCEDDVYALQRAQMAVESFELILYHEAQHDVFCSGYLRSHGLKREELARSGLPKVDMCEIEAPAYAAQVRLLAAMRDAGGEPTTFSPDGRDFGTAKMIYHAWEALDQKRFCPWLHEISETSRIPSETRNRP